MPLFSVVIPLYNKERYIEATLKSVLIQTCTDFEVIVVNDASTDGSLAVVQNITDPRLRIISHPVNKGLSASRNTGIKNSNADYVAFLDADDIWKNGFLETIKTLIITYPDAALFATKYEEVYPNNVIIEPVFNLNLSDAMGIIAYYSSNLNQSIYYPSCLCVKKEVFDSVGYYNESITYGEDIDFNIRAHYSFKLAYSNKALVSYTMDSQNQITRSGIKNKVITDFDSYEPLAVNRPDIKHFLDFHRYVMAKTYKVGGDKKNFKKMLASIQPGSLNFKQRVLLASPVAVLKLIGRIKNLLLKKGIVANSYN